MLLPLSGIPMLQVSVSEAQNKCYFQIDLTCPLHLPPPPSPELCPLAFPPGFLFSSFSTHSSLLAVGVFH